LYRLGLRFIMSEIEEKIKIAASFLLEAPPGEFHEVLNDLRVLINNDAILQKGITSAVHQYNVSQFITGRKTYNISFSRG
jgi:hypothetical protein